MSEPLYLKPEYRTANEPKLPSLIKGSFIFVQSAGMRLAPEILVLELMREVFLGKHFNDDITKAKEIDPDERKEDGNYRFSNRERAVLYSLQGRRKKTKNSADQIFFAPAYPQLAELGWLRKNSERAINNFLFAGPVAQDLFYGAAGTGTMDSKLASLSQKVQKALLGNKSCLNHDPRGTDILAATLQHESFKDDYKNPEIAKNNIKNMVTSRHGSLLKIDNDEISACITRDLEVICELEGKIPRMQWLQLLMTFLRFALPMWLLAQMQVTQMVHEWIIHAVDTQGDIPNTELISSNLAARNRDILHPTLTPTRELFEHIDRYMKCRVELNIFLYCLSAANKDLLDITNDNLVINLDGGGRNKIGIEELLFLARDSSAKIRELERFKKVAKDLDIKTFLTREGEQFSNWRNPRKSGVGKNIDEFFRVLYQSEIGDESGGYLLTSAGKGANRGFMVFPGHLLLKTMAYLSARDKQLSHGSSGGILVLQDVEDHFSKYGIDFSNAADARPKLMEKLQSMGLLRGSPDAGSSVAVEIPY